MSVLTANIVASLDTARMWEAHQEPSDWQTRKFRTPSLLPPCDYEQTFAPQTYRPSAAASIVAGVVLNRADLVASSGVVTDRRTGDGLGLGRLLRHNFAEATCTGVPGKLTDGFFDSYDTPAWDMWIAFVGDDIDLSSNATVDYLISWIPPFLIERVNEAVRTSFEENILWLDTTHTRLTQALRKER